MTVLDLAVLDLPERRGVDLAALALCARVLERGGPQQAADVVGAKRGLAARHCCHLPSVNSSRTILAPSTMARIFP